MKKKKNAILSTMMIVFVALTFISCGSSDHDNNIIEALVERGDFTTLVAALQAADLDDDLAGVGPFTVFAPTDDAFNALPAGTVDFLLQPENKDTLIDILTYHVYDEKIFADEVIALAGTAVTMLNGLDLRIDVIMDEVVLNLNGDRQATVTITNVYASNGVIHVIDAVLNPDDATKNIVETAVDNGNFTTLVAALQAAELDDDLAGDGPFTVFAPTDDAFNALPAGTVDFLLEPGNKDTLIDILTYHVFSGSVLAADAVALDGTAVTMLNGLDLSLDVVGKVLFLNIGGVREATVILTDVLCSNGVIHVIDAVLDPGDAP